MPLISPEDPGMTKVNLQQRFRELPASDQQNVLKFIEMGRSGEPHGDRVEFTDDGEEFIHLPEFRRMFETQVMPPPPPESPMVGMVKGLMEIIKQQALPGQVPEGHLKPEYAERVGGKQKGLAGVCQACGHKNGE